MRVVVMRAGASLVPDSAGIGYICLFVTNLFLGESISRRIIREPNRSNGTMTPRHCRPAVHETSTDVEIEEEKIAVGDEGRASCRHEDGRRDVFVSP